jgi:hypothetical protein
MKSLRTIPARIASCITLGVACLSIQPETGHAQNCRADIAKLCAQAAPGRSRVSQCLRQGFEQLSPGCKSHVRAVSVQLKETRQPCEDDLQLLCEGQDLTEDRIAGCLQRNRAALTADCRRLSDRMQKIR